MFQRRNTINRALAMNGLATTDKPRALIAQIAFLTNTEERFRNLLARVEPEKRRDCYESLRPHLKFPVKSLDVYMAEAAMDAEKKQLPEWDEDTHTVREHGTQAQKDAISRMMSDALAGSDIGILELTCRRCTFTETIRAATRRKAIKKAIDGGWKKEGKEEKRKFLCKVCASGRVQ